MFDRLASFVSDKSLYLLHLTTHHSALYKASARTLSRVELPQWTHDLKPPKDWLSLQGPVRTTPWVILIDQSEEFFWRGDMPALRGVAKSIWLKRLAADAGVDSPFFCSQLQGKSQVDKTKRRVLGYTLGRAPIITAWLDWLSQASVPIRGVYAPALLTQSALKVLNRRKTTEKTAVVVITTPHPEGLRQTVLINGHIQFSRLALHSLTSRDAWALFVYAQTARLRDFLLNDGLLEERQLIRIIVILPPGLSLEHAPSSSETNPYDQYESIKNPVSVDLYVAALAKQVPYLQLAPSEYLQLDRSRRLTRLNYIFCTLLGGLAITLALTGLWYFWHTKSQIEVANHAALQARQQYENIKKTYPQSPLTPAQLTTLHKLWGDYQTQSKLQQPADMQALLVFAGQTLQKYPQLQIDEIQWVIPSVGSSATPLATTTASLPSASLPTATLTPATLTLRGKISHFPTSDLRRSRDVLSQFVDELNRQKPTVSAQVIKRSLDFSPHTTLAGPRETENSEPQFELAIWQQR